MRKVTLLATLLLLAPSVAQAKTLEDLLVEKGVISKGEAAASASAGASKVYWNKGTRVDFPSEGFTFGVNTLIQTRYTFDDADEKTGGRNSSSFDVTKARVIFSGNVLNEEFSYYLQADFVGSNDANGVHTPSLKDAYLTWHACDVADVRMGQFKTGLGREFNTPDEYLEFADRSAVSDFFTLGRQAGGQASAKLLDGAVKVGLGLFNGLSTGEGINTGGVDTRHTGVLTIRGDVLGQQNPFVDSDMDNTQDPALNAGFAYGYSSAATTAIGKFDEHDINADVNFKWAGWSANAEYFYKDIDPSGAGAKVEPQGFYVQGGYFVVPNELEVAARYGFIDCDNGKAAMGVCSGLAGGTDKVNEVTVGVNYYFWKHHLKAQLNYAHLNMRAVSDGTEDGNDNRWLLQLSSYL